MMQSRCEILWSPTFEDYFLMWSSNLQLYQVHELTPDDQTQISATRIQLSPKSVADIVATNSDHQYVKCVAWYHGIKEDPLDQVVAVGQASGKIALANFAHSSNHHRLSGNEFVPKNSRPVNVLVWNSHYHQYLAAGYDKAGKDHSIYVFDVTKGIPTSSLAYESKSSCNSEHLQITSEWSTGDTVHAVEFSKNDPQMLLAGINNRQIKLYDFREIKSVNSISTKAVYGISCDPFNNRRLASYAENTVHIWDMRNFERPVLTLADSSSKSIFKLAWCTTRYGFLSSLCRESSSLRLYDIQQHGAEEDQEPAVVTRSISAQSESVISSFSWHPTHENRMLTAYHSGELVDQIVTERVTLNWSIGSSIIWSNGKKYLQFIDNCSPFVKHLNDISTLIKERAINGYGLEKETLSLNGEITKDSMLKRLWMWLEEARKLVRDCIKIPGGIPYSYHGVLSLLNKGGLNSDILNKQWIGVEGSKTVHAKVFVSEERNLCLALCSWGFEKEGSLNEYLDHLESFGLYTKAAAVAVFNLQIPQAIRILRKGALVLNEPAYNTTAMALAGFTSERKALWRETCSDLLRHLSDPYLRTTFAFLTGESETYDPILKEHSISVHDRVAFACKFLSDVRLLEFIQTLRAELVEIGSLDGILLTGLNGEGQDLLQRYIDLTGDIQTVALLVVHTIQHIHQDIRLQNWVENYRNLLDSLQLWKERVQIDVLRNQRKTASKLPQQICISCNFCLKSISAYIQTPGRPRNSYDRFGTGATNKLKMTACPNPNCRRPLPRCSLCLQHMGTPSKRGNATGRNPPTDDSTIPSAETNIRANLDRSIALKQFNNWFTWCHSCRHGGHAQHMIQWFKSHMECPVSTCSCKCMCIDAVNKRSQQPFMMKL